MDLVADSALAYGVQSRKLTSKTMTSRRPAPNSIDVFLRDVSRRARLTAEFATRDRDVAQDIVQEAMLTLVSKYGQHDPSSWGPLFHRILHSRLMDHFRRETRRRKWFTFLESPDEEGLEDPWQQIPDTVDHNPVTLLQRADNMDVVLDAVRDLPMRQQQAFLLRAWEGYDTAQTAEIMGCAEGSVKTHYFRALNNIRAKLGAIGTTAEDMS
ncbi:MAG: RNA polymerase sigma factor [Pseudomonadota bacterium]